MLKNITVLILVFLMLMGYVNIHAENIQNNLFTTSNTPKDNQKIASDVLRWVKLLEEEIELLRIAIGKPKSTQIPFEVSNAHPREVYYQAQALFEKANRLKYEVTNEAAELPPVPTREINLTDTWKLVNAALLKILSVKKTLGITQKAKVIPNIATATSSEVMNALLQTNRDLNSLLYMQFKPSDVYAQITLAIFYSQDLLKEFPNIPKVSSTPHFVPNKTPSDVFTLLVNCMSVLKDIYISSDLNILSIQVNEEGIKNIKPTIVFNLSKIVVSEVSYLNTLTPSRSENIQTFYPGYKMPSNVYQQTTLLLKQLKTIKKQVRKNKGWLKKSA